jgi:hypothetical protein
LIRRSQQLSVDFLEVELPQTLAIKSRPGPERWKPIIRSSKDYRR